MAEGRLENDHDVEQILKLAVRGAGFSDEEALRQRLTLAGSELGLSDSQIAAAEKQYYRDKKEQELKKEFEGEAWHEFMEHVWSYVIVNGGLLAFDLFKDGDISWSLYPLIGWGIGLAFHAYSIFFPGKKNYEEEFSKWRRKSERRSRRRRKGLVVGVNIGGSGILASEDEEEAGSAKQ